MLTIFQHTLSRLRGQILGWGLTFTLIGWYIVAIYDTFIGQAAQMTELIKSYPPAMMAFFGEAGNIFTVGGYLDFTLFSYGAVVLCLFAVLMGSGLIVADEEAGRLDLLQAHPVSRTAFFAGRFWAMVVAILLVLALTWGGMALGLLNSELEVTFWTMTLPFIASWALIMLFASFALLLSMVLPSRTLAASTSSLLLVASYFVTSLARVIEDLKDAERFSPLHYFQGGYAVEGLKMSWFGGLLLVAALFTLAAWWAYQRRDLRVGGEGNWQLPRVNFFPAIRFRTTSRKP
jgi:ABC-2 type transport system permease protein